MRAVLRNAARLPRSLALARARRGAGALDHHRARREALSRSPSRRSRSSAARGARATSSRARWRAISSSRASSASSRATPIIENAQSSGVTAESINFDNWSVVGALALVKGSAERRGDDLTVEARLFDVAQHKQLAGRRFHGRAADEARMAQPLRRRDHRSTSPASAGRSTRRSRSCPRAAAASRTST